MWACRIPTWTFLALISFSVASASVWSSANCNKNNESGDTNVVSGTVTDAICCDVTTTGSECGGLSQADCIGTNRCHWYVDKPDDFQSGVHREWDPLTNSYKYKRWDANINGWSYSTNDLGEGKCKLNRDSRNNVCCHEDVNDVCGSLLQGKCPYKFQMSHSCCSDGGYKYQGTLQVDNDTMACCNTPCGDMDAAFAAGKTECTIDIQDKPHCSPGERGYMRFFQPNMMGNRGMPGMMGGLAGMGAGMGGGMGAAMGGPGGGMFNAQAMQALLGFGGGAGGRKMGNVVQGFGNQGLPGTLGLAALKEAGEGQSKEKHVEEITVDDLMMALIDALDNDKDVFDYEKEITSDPWFKKQGHGGVKNSFSFIDPWMFLDQIYGSPFGMSNAQMSYGKMYGIPQSSFSSPKFGGIGGQQGRGGMGGVGMGQMGGRPGGLMGGPPGGMGGMMGGMGGMMGGRPGMGGMMGGRPGMGGMMGGRPGMGGMMGGMRGPMGGHQQQGGMMGGMGGFGQQQGMGGFGQPPRGMGGFGQPSQSSMGGYQSMMGGYGQPPQSQGMGGFGQSPAGMGPPPQGGMGGYGQQSQGGMGGYAQQSQGQMGGFGQQSQGGFGQHSQGGYGQQSQGGFGQQSQGGFGQQSQGGFGQQSPGGFGQHSQGGMGGGFGQPSQGGQPPSGPESAASSQGAQPSPNSQPDSII